MTDMINKQSAPVRNVLNMLAMTCHEMSRSKGFWDKFDQVVAAFPEIEPELLGNKIALIHSEASETLECLRKPGENMSAKIPDYTCEADECADILIRLMDYVAKRNIDIGGAVIAKMQYNSNRPHMHGKTM